MEDQTLKAEPCKPILGYTDSKTVKLDFDDPKRFKSVKYWALKANEKFKLGGGIILKSSKDGYHVVFDRYVSWVKNLSIMAWVAILSKSVPMLRYLAMQCIKGASTLRVSPNPDKDKPSPRLVYRFGCQDHAVKDFLRYRQLIKRIYSSLH